LTIEILRLNVLSNLIFGETMSKELEIVIAKKSIKND